MAKEKKMTIKTTFILGLTFLFLSCGQQTKNNETRTTEPKLVNDSILEKAKSDTKTKKKKEETASPYQEELNKALADTTIDDYYKEIYRQEKLFFADDNKMLSVTDSLFTDNPDKDLFHFIVYTKSMNGSDGFYSEAIGLSSFKFITTKTEKFADYFNIAPKLTDQDMDNWAKSVYGEIQISRENEEETAVTQLETQLFENIKEARKEYRVIIEQFIEKIKSTMP